MTYILRALALIPVWIGIALLIQAVMGPVWDFSFASLVAAAVFLVLSVLSFRCVRWLWREKRFWLEVASFRDVCTFSVLLVLGPIVAVLERHLERPVRHILHVAFVAVLFVAYVAAARFHRSRACDDKAKNEQPSV
jgi:hypothetical protein